MVYPTNLPKGLNKKIKPVKINEFVDENRKTGNANKNKRSATSNKNADEINPILLNIIVFYINSTK